jgi:soluble lytic murein transglycosylase-like protein
MISQNITKVLQRISSINKQFEKLFKGVRATQNQNSTAQTSSTPVASQTPAGNFTQQIENAIRTNSSTQNNASIYENTLSNLANSSYKYKDIILEASAKYGLKPNLIRAIIKTESDFNPNAVSNKGAKGLMQIMPVHYNNLGITNPFDARQNIMAGSKLFKGLFDRYNKNINKALAAYNAGINALESGRTENNASVLRYIKKVLSHFNNYGG